MADINWYPVKFLESTTNLKNVLKDAIGRTPSTNIARQAAVCLQHGRMYYESAAVSPLEIRPLLIFYGMVGFAASLVVARKFKGLATFNRSHGLEDQSRPNVRLQELEVSIRGHGMFQKFNDTISDLERIRFYIYYERHSIPVPTCKSDRLHDKILTLKEILARIPDLASFYRQTFHERAKTLECLPSSWTSYPKYGELQVSIPETYDSLGTLETIVRDYRLRFPFLENWCLTRAHPGYDKSTLDFSNLDKTGIQEFSEESFLKEGIGTTFSFAPPGFNVHTHPRRNIAEIVMPLARGLRDTGYAIEPFEGLYLPELSLYYLGMFLLSSLVRYHPEIWGHALSRRATSEWPADDNMLTLIEQFLDLALLVFPQAIVHAISQRG